MTYGTHIYYVFVCLPPGTPKNLERQNRGLILAFSQKTGYRREGSTGGLV